MTPPPDPRTASRRAAWPVRVFPLEAAPGDDLSATTTAVERLEMMWPLALEAWALCGRGIPRYGRGDTPVTRRAWPRPR